MSFLPFKHRPSHKNSYNLAKTWSLKKIIYPTGGSISYNLETSTFNLWGQNLNGPGVRVASKSIATSTTSSAPKVIAYNYNLSNGNSSGSIYNFPLAGYPLKQLFSSYEDDYGVIHSAGSSYMGEPSLYKTFLLFQALSKSKATIKYSRVQQTEGNKKTVNEYETITNKSKRYFRNFYPNNGINDFGMHCISDFLFTNSGLGKDNTGFINTYLVSAKIYEGNIILAESIKKYKNNFTKELYTQPSPNNYCFHESFIRNSSTAFDVFPSWNYENLIIYDKHYFTRSNYLIESINTDYFPSGTNIKTTSYSYDSTIWGKDPIQSGTSITDNSGNFYLTQFIYPDETYTALVENNMLTTSLGHKMYKNGFQVSTSAILYDFSSILPSGIAQTNRQQDNNQNIFFEIYDDRGNLISYWDSEGIPTTILYGYNQTLPIAVIKGTTFDGLTQELNFPTNNVSEYLNLEIVKKSNLDVDESTENALITELDNFRKQLNFRQVSYQITTYTYDTLLGVTTLTPPTGMTQKYIYNSVTNKLEKIVDKDDNILKEFKYNYKH